MPRALVLSVGTGTRSDVDITRPLTKAVRQANPDYVCFLASAESERYARAVAEELELSAAAWNTTRVADVNDVEAIFRDGLQTLQEVQAKGFSAADIDVDFTSGTKAMSAGLVLAAVAVGCGHLRYIAGTRREGIVVDDTERFLAMRPVALMAYRQLELARLLLSRLQFRGAVELCDAVAPILLDGRSEKRRQGVRGLALAYDAWDKFSHLEFRREYRGGDLASDELTPFRLAAGVPDRLVKIAATIKNREITPDLIADLFANAERRLGEGRFDDAVARLYRVAEMLAQYQLRQRGIDTADVDLAKLPEQFRETFDRKRDPAIGKVKIGLQDGYELLAALGDALGASYEGRLASKLADRNRSILAHGTTPITSEQAQALRDAVLALAETLDPDFAERQRELQFPWLTDAPGKPMASA